MTDHRLRELLEERVADLAPVGLADGAWERARAVRRRRRTVAGVAAAVVAVVGGTAVVVTGNGGDAPPPPATSPTESATVPKAERAGEYGGVPVWSAPTVREEADLPKLAGSALPPEIDLSATAPAPVGLRAVALFQVWRETPGRVVVLGADGASYLLDAGHLDPFDDGGNLMPPVSQQSLSPDGRYAFFRQERALEVYDFDAGTWATIATAADANPESAQWEGGLIRVPESASDPDAQLYEPNGERAGRSLMVDLYGGPLPRDEAYGPVKGLIGAGSRGLFLAGRGVDALGVIGRTRPGVLLAMPAEQEGRWLQCCPAVGWLDPATVLFESRHEKARVLAWRFGTSHVYRVSDIRGWTPGQESYVASYAAVDGSVGAPS